MKINTLKILFIITIAICYSHNVSAQNNPVAESTSSNVKTIRPMNKVKDEKTFVKHSDEALSVMEKKAKEQSIMGVAIVGFIPGDKTSTWTTKMKVVGVLSNDKTNYLAIASSKAADMAVTLQNSGIDKSRTPLKGEFGYQGGLIKRISTGYIFAVFSGGSSEQDLKVSQEGLDSL